MGFFTGKQVLVTGAGGFIGSHLAEALIEAGAKVTGTLSPRPEAKNFLGKRNDLNLEAVDLTDQTIVEKLVKKAEMVFHLAAKVGGLTYNLKHPASIYRDNLRLTFPILEACREVRIEKLCLVSSACVYPRFCTIPTPESEGFKEQPEPSNEGYGLAKRILEYAGNAYAKEYGMKVVIARPYNAYGPRDNFHPEEAHVIPALIRRVLLGEDPLTVWGDGSHSRSFLFVKDLVKGLLVLMEKATKAEAFNLGADEEVTIRELAETIIRLSGKSPRLVFDPKGPTGQPRRRCDTTKAERELGFRAATPLEEGLRQTIAWYREHA